MYSSTNTTSVTRTRSSRIPPSSTTSILQPSSATATSSAPGISNIALFLTNLRLLDLDLRGDWPNITDRTFSTKDAQQNQKKRIHCVEWALCQLFELWDPEETQNKLQPFIPPREPLQSLNLRTALYRCLDQLKKTGVLGRDTVLRKTMLDECKGERLEEVLAVFSNAVLKKVLLEGGSAEHQALAQQLSFENFSYSGERTVLSALILSHKASLNRHLQEKHMARAKYTDFSELLKLNDRRIARRQEQLKEMLEEGGRYEPISVTEIRSLQSQVQKNWSGSEAWLGAIIYGDSKAGEDGLLSNRFEKVWQHVEDGSIGEVEYKGRVGLLEQLDARVKDQENRLARWQDFSRALAKAGTISPSKKMATSGAEGNKIDLGFDCHQDIQITRNSSGKTIETVNASLEEYDWLIRNMASEIAEVRKPRGRDSRPTLQGLQNQISTRAPEFCSPQHEAPVDIDEEWISASEAEDAFPGFASGTLKSTSLTPLLETVVVDRRPIESELDMASVEDVAESGFGNDQQETFEAIKEVLPPRDIRSPSPLPPEPSPPQTTLKPQNPDTNKSQWVSDSVPLMRHETPQPDAESDLVNEILNSMSSTSPSPKKPRHTLSLAERTRLSMSRASHSQLSDLHDDFDIKDLPRLSIKPRPSLAPRKPTDDSESDLHAGLIERTRNSMAGFEAAQKKAQLERRKSMKEAKKKQRESSYFPRVEEEIFMPDTAPTELIEGDPDYESVFKSRPKIKTSPAVSPTRIREDESEGS
ncbi:Uncharacterized protein BP5553_03239 [Venustampulla echinocandica]|uniref:HAUS augmin-like complex subunit 6 N-terminal domain-containing protein n=1 Tax=Venustampulla echinocandica TaxID=2656787 RepID=A0A370TTN8_9HELO|nr:Uncharacterized protein BP5553_03239 [Venustampulla echinocandica]RDL38899.1 Uncharacterized protein BP5553_03239 [Venustampulla echinocandica]